MSDQITLEGGCLCGALRYRIDGSPRVVSHCHCGLCRRVSGAPFVTWLTVRKDRVTITGDPVWYRLERVGPARLLSGLRHPCSGRVGPLRTPLGHHRRQSGPARPDHARPACVRGEQGRMDRHRRHPAGPCHRRDCRPRRGREAVKRAAVSQQPDVPHSRPCDRGRRNRGMTCSVFAQLTGNGSSFTGNLTGSGCGVVRAEVVNVFQLTKIQS